MEATGFFVNVGLLSSVDPEGTFAEFVAGRDSPKTATYRLTP